MPLITKHMSGTFGIKVAKVTASGNIKTSVGVIHGMVVVTGDVILTEGTVGADNTGSGIIQLQAGASAGDGTSAYTLPKPYSFGQYGCYAHITGTTVAYVYYE